MGDSTITENLRRLRQAADGARNGFPKTTWTRIAGPGPDQMVMDGAGTLGGLRIEQGHEELVLQCDLNLPDEAVGVALAGDRLEATLNTRYPSEVLHNGRAVFSDLVVAAGPALFTVLDKISPGANGRLTARVKIPKHQTVNSFFMKLTTPGLRARFEQLDVAWAQLAIADAMAVGEEERQAVARAAALVTEILQSPVKAAAPLVEKLASILRPLDKKAKSVSVHLIGHSHIDMNWLWLWPDTVEVIRRDFRSVLSLMDDYPELTFSHSQPATYEVIRTMEPALFARVLAHIKSGRWEAISMQWVEPDSNMPSGEAHVRQLLEGVGYSRDILGATPTTFHSPDTFGHAGNIPQLAASAGAKAYYHHRVNPGQHNAWPAYWWQGQDGTRLFVISSYGYVGEITAGDIAGAAIRAHKWGHPAAINFHGIGDHGGGPARQNLDALRRLQKLGGLPKMLCGTTAGYFKQMIDSGVSLPMHEGESRTIFEGCYTTHADTKRYNRQGENMLCAADTLSALAGQNRTADLTEAWRKVLFNQFHDILDGSAIHESYINNAADFAEVTKVADDVIESALRALQGGVKLGRIAVTNPLGFDREDLVVVGNRRGSGAVWLIDDRGNVVPGQYTGDGLIFVAHVPAFSTVSFGVADHPPARQAPVVEAVTSFAITYDPMAIGVDDGLREGQYLRVETPHFIAYVRRDCGVITSFRDKRAGRELVSFGMRRASDYIDSARPDLGLNVFQILDEYPHDMNAWQLHEVHSEHSLIRGASTRVIETGPVRCVIEVTHSVRSSTITQKIAFYHALPRIDFQTNVDWKEIGTRETGIRNLKVAFTARMDECQAWFETPFAAVRRPADGQETPALRWADVGGADYGIALLNQDKYGYDVLGCRLRLSLLRSAYDPDAISDAGKHEMRYSLFPHVGDWRDAGVVQAGLAFNHPLLARESAAKAVSASSAWRPRISSKGSSVEIACLKIARNGVGRIIRLYETAGRAANVTLDGLGDAAISETNILEDALRRIDNRDGAIDLSFSPWQVRTLLVGD